MIEQLFNPAVRAIEALTAKNEPIIIGCHFDAAEYGDLLDKFGTTQLPDHMMLRVCAKATREEFEHMCSVLNIKYPSRGEESEAFYRCKVEVTQ